MKSIRMSLFMGNLIFLVQQIPSALWGWVEMLKILEIVL